MQSPLNRAPMAWAAVVAILFVVARAVTQSISIDEAMTYLMFAGRSPEFLLWPASNNHVLNSLLMYPFIKLLGPSEASVRAGAIIGACVYISASYRLAGLYSPLTLRWAMFLSLVFNPMVLDYLVAARGYGLATGFLLWAIVLFALPQPWTLRRCALCSVCLGLSVISNFAFAVVNAFMLAAILIAVRKAPLLKTRVFAALVLPGALVVSVVIPTLLRWPHGQLFFGATSLSEMFVTLLDGSLHPMPWGTGLPYLGLSIAVLVFAFALVHACVFLRSGAHHATLLRLSGSLAAVAVGTLLVHWILFRTTGLLLPKERTALYLVPIVTVIIAGVASSHPVGDGWTQRALLLAFSALATFFLLSIRWSSFHQWEWDADTRQLYREAVRLNHAGCSRTIVADWRYAACLEFYQKIHNANAFEKILVYESGEVPTRNAVFVLHPRHNRIILETNNLHVVYRTPRSEAVIAVPANSCPAGGSD